MKVEEVIAMLPVDQQHLDELRDSLGAKALATDSVDVVYREIDSPIGPLLLAATTSGLVRIAFAREDFDVVLQSLSDRLGAKILQVSRPLDPVAHELEEYFDGRRRSFDLPLDHSLSSGFRREVRQYLPHIQYGQTASYSQVASRVGNPKAVRAVGTACATNPLPIIVPCHRVLRSDGSLGGYLGGIDAKKILLDLEYSS